MEYSADPDQLYRMFEMIGSDEILLFSSDYPHWDFDSPTHSIPRSFPKEVKNKILYENARKWYDF
jgi:predicted TIM-barrel fold metal-dependent hydrolase